MKKQDYLEAVIPLVNKHFPKGKCKERGAAIVLIAEIWIKMLRRVKV